MKGWLSGAMGVVRRTISLGVVSLGQRRKRSGLGTLMSGELKIVCAHEAKPHGMVQKDHAKRRNRAD